MEIYLHPKSHLTTPKARKDHTCRKCRGTIRDGDEYVRSDDFGPTSYAVCGPCAPAEWPGQVAWAESNPFEAAWDAYWGETSETMKNLDF